ncbi:MAG TPA: Do family serine endopeptidase [Xanthobacteraceae bacterium]|nr:Do family serine endopeptidase [Xanthobacteraceae bacterium]
MTGGEHSAPRYRGPTARRVALLATVAGLGLGVFFVSPGHVPQPTLPGLTAAQAQNVTQEAQTVSRPVGFADVVEKVKPAVISVRVKVENKAQISGLDGEGLPPGLERFFRQFGQPDGGQNGQRGPRGGGPGGPRNFSTGQGSGFFISADGFAVTNNHVVEKASTVQVKTDDGKTYDAKVIGTDPRSDLALIKVDGRNDFPYAKLSEKSPRIGDWVLAVGNPFGLGGTVTAGIVSARSRDIGAGPYDDFIQIDAPVNKGNSGGPTFDVDGNVIGVNTAIFSPSGGSVGIAFAIPSETVRTVVTQLKDHGTVTRGWIGVQIQPVTPEIAESLGLKKAEGALVAEAQANGPAAKAGIQSGAVITSVNGSPVTDARDLAKKIGAMAPGNSVKIGVIEKGAEKTVNLTLGELPPQREAKAEPQEGEQPGGDIGKLGLTLAPASTVAGSGSEGVVITGVDPDGAAADAGFKTGDVILDVAGKAVSSPADVRKVLADARSDGKKNILMRVKSATGTRFVALPLARG